MLYVSKYDLNSGKYGVTDTDDGSVEWLESGELFNIVRKHKLRIEGVDLSVSRIHVVKPKYVGQKRVNDIEARFNFLDDRIGFDYLIERHDTKEFSEFVVSMGGDTCRYRVYGTNGSYSVYAK